MLGEDGGAGMTRPAEDPREVRPRLPVGRWPPVREPGPTRGHDRAHGGAPRRPAGGPVTARRAVALLRASHPLPTAAVTTVTVVLGLASGLGGRTALLGVAVLAGQLSVGWSNDLVDAARDRSAGRADKPLASGELSAAAVRGATGVALVVCVVGSLGLGTVPGLVHLGLGVAAGWVYNLLLKGTVWSWLPYVVAFGSLPVVVRTALDPPVAAPVWLVGGGALLGLGAHLLNVLPDLDDDAATGVRGLPHRLGARRSTVLALALLGAASVLVVVGPPGPVPPWAWAALAGIVVVVLAGGRAGGRTPFRVAMAVALADVVVLLVRGG